MSVVTTTADAGAGSLRQAIADASGGDTITFSVAGAITLTSGQLVINKDLTITGPGNTLLLVRRSSGSFRPFYIDPAATVTIKKMSIGYGTETTGGNIHNEGTLTLEEVILVNGAASAQGGGIANYGTLTMATCNFNSNSCLDSGGGIYNNGTLIATGCSLGLSTIDSATDGFGAGLWNDGTATLDHCDVSNNSISAINAYGGGIYNAGTITLIDTSVQLNSLVGDNSAGECLGGGVFNDFGSTLHLTRSTIATNNASAATVRGAGVANIAASITVDNSTTSGNALTGQPFATGGAFYNDGSLAIKHSTITANSTGIYTELGAVTTLFNTIVAFNGTNDISGPYTSLGHNCFGVTFSPLGAGDQGGLTVQQLKLGPLQGNGGPTATHALLPGSVAIDAGDNTSAPATDQRGETRVVHTTIDVGAYESVPVENPPPPPPPTEVTVCVDAAAYQSEDSQDDANARAYAAALAQARAQLDCPLPPDVECPGPPFADVSVAGEITGDSISVNQPGCFNRLVTFSGTAGDKVSIWYASHAYDAYLYLLDPALAVLAQDDSSGYQDLTNDPDNCAITYTLPVTGIYTCDCTTYDPNKIGTFKLVVTCANTVALDLNAADPNNLNHGEGLIYHPATKRLFTFNGLGVGPTQTGPTVNAIDTDTNAVIHAFDLFAPEDLRRIAGAIYSTASDRIYVPQIANGYGNPVQVLNPTTYAVETTIDALNSVPSSVPMAYDPVNDRVFIANGGGVIALKEIVVIDCATNTVSNHLSTAPDVVAGMAYCNGFVYLLIAGAIKKLNCTTLAITNSGLTYSNAPIRSVPALNLLFSDRGGYIRVIDALTDTEVDALKIFSQGFEAVAWHECRDRIFIALSARYSTSGSGFGLIDYDYTNKLTKSWVYSPTAFNSNPQSCLTYDPIHSLVYGITARSQTLYGVP